MRVGCQSIKCFYHELSQPSINEINRTFISWVACQLGAAIELSRWLEGDWYIILMVIGWWLVVIGGDWQDKHLIFIARPYDSGWQVWESEHSSGSKINSESRVSWMLYNTKRGKGVRGRIDGGCGWRHLFLEFYGRCVFARARTRANSRISQVDFATHWHQDNFKSWNQQCSEIENLQHWLHGLFDTWHLGISKPMIATYWASDISDYSIVVELGFWQFGIHKSWDSKKSKTRLLES